jgi:CheY-like chemotaxis protein
MATNKAVVIADGGALLDAAALLRPDVVVLDVAMPLLNGFDACRQLRQKMPDNDGHLLGAK